MKNKELIEEARAPLADIPGRLAFDDGTSFFDCDSQKVAAYLEKHGEEEHENDFRWWQDFCSECDAKIRHCYQIATTTDSGYRLYWTGESWTDPTAHGQLEAMTYTDKHEADKDAMRCGGRVIEI